MSTELFGFTLFVRDQTLAKDFFLHALGFHLVQDTGLDDAGGGTKRRVVVSPSVEGTEGVQLVLVQASSAAELALLGKQAVGKVLFYLKTSDIQACYLRYKAAGVAFESTPTVKPHGTVAVFLDIAGNRWDLIQA
jgi:catechol 2,3-dioxygenase-like lactoylglutathione lyase family enzyme